MANYKGDDRLEAHYTPKELIDEMFVLLKKHYKKQPLEYLETSAGDGRIVDRFDKPYLAYDIISSREDIIQTDYLKEKIPYREGRVCIMNPPFAKGLKFLNKALKESDYVVTILSQNSILNIDYTKVWCDEIQLYKNYDFGTCKVGITIIACRKKTNEDRYEFE